jgi:hypothetical protein
MRPLAAPLRHLLGTILGALLTLGALLGAMAPAALAMDGTGALAERLEAWPQWQLPAPLPRPGRTDLIYPDWFEGQWQASLQDPSGLQPELRVVLRFERDRSGAVVGDRAFNAAAIGRALLGESLLSVRDDPRNPNRQIALLSGDRQLESTVVGRRSEQPDTETLLADELSLQVLHGSGDPRVSRVETLSRYRLLTPGRIDGEQWQASYDSPAQGLAAAARRSWSGTLHLDRVS